MNKANGNLNCYSHPCFLQLCAYTQSDYLGSRKTVSRLGTGTIDHIAFSGSDYPALIEQLKYHRPDYFERTAPLTGEHQVFVEGPEVLRVEIQFENEMHSQLEDK